jgi:glyoxylase-like metal-dependent hydrolase (beta-lactamase superfamily II)
MNLTQTFRRSIPAFTVILASSLLICAFSSPAAAQSCGAQGVAAQVLGSGGPELQDKRAMSSYLIWENGQARVLVDAGGGSALRFGESGANMSQLDVILFTHLHVDHSADFPALIKSSWFEDRKTALPIYGPPGNDYFPDTKEFVSEFFSDRGVYRYLSELLVPGEQGSYKMQPHDVIAKSTPIAAFQHGDMAASAVRVIHGGVPALAWRVEVAGKVIVFSGDTNGAGEGLVRLASNRANRRGCPRQKSGSLSSDASHTREGRPDAQRDQEALCGAGNVRKRPRLLSSAINITCGATTV